MDQRKLIKLGNSSFAIALPKNWIDKAGLKKGDNIFITPNSNGELIIQPTYTGSSQESEVVLNFEGKTDEEIEREISASYVRDYNIFKIVGISKNKRNYVEHLLKSLISLEIIEKNNDSIVAKDYFNLKEANLENFLRRIDNSLRNMFEEMGSYLKKGSINNKELKEIYEIDWDINRIYFLIYRIFVKSLNNPSLLSVLNVDSLTLLDNWQIAVNIGKIGDELKSICKLVNRNEKLKEKEKILSLFLDAKKIYLEVLLSYYNKDMDLAKKTTFYRKEQIKKCNELSEDKNIVVAQAAEKFEHLFSFIHEVSKLILYTTNKNDRK